MFTTNLGWSVPQVIEYKLQHGADVNRRNRDNLTPLDMVKGHDSDIADLLRGDDALLDASKKGDLDRVKKLVTPQNINCRDENGRNSTPLHLAGMCVLSYIHVVRILAGNNYC